MLFKGFLLRLNKQHHYKHELTGCTATSQVEILSQINASSAISILYYLTLKMPGVDNQITTLNHKKHLWF